MYRLLSGALGQHMSEHIEVEVRTEYPHVARAAVGWLIDFAVNGELSRCVLAKTPNLVLSLYRHEFVDLKALEARPTKSGTKTSSLNSNAICGCETFPGSPVVGNVRSWAVPNVKSSSSRVAKSPFPEPYWCLTQKQRHNKQPPTHVHSGNTSGRERGHECGSISLSSNVSHRREGTTLPNGERLHSASTTAVRVLVNSVKDVRVREMTSHPRRVGIRLTLTGVLEDTSIGIEYV